MSAANTEFAPIPYIRGTEDYPHFICVTNSYDGTLSVIDPITSSAIKTIPVGNGPRSMFSYSLDRIYVTNFGDNTVSVVDTATFTINETIPVGNGPESVIGFENYVYVANMLNDSITIIDATTNNVNKTIPVGEAPSALTEFYSNTNSRKSENYMSV